MTSLIFTPTSFETMVRLVVGDCNGVGAFERWEKETPLFARQIATHIDDSIKVVLDYGCGVGRLAKALLQERPSLDLIGIDDSPAQLQTALAFVNDERFETLLPRELTRPVDLIYCIYVFQHMPAIEIREALQRMHHFLKPGGKLLYCSSDTRMAVRYDRPQFFDDRFLGVNIRQEVERYFEPKEMLFPESMIQNDPLLQTIILGKGAKKEAGETFLPHPAIVYQRKELSELPFNAPRR